MKIGISTTKDNWSSRWVEFCTEQNIEYKKVNPFSNDIIEELMDCDIFLWHYRHGTYPDSIMAKELLFALEQSGKKIFPNFNTAWHFDDKLGQKYLFEALSIPTVPTYVFYNKESALQWVETTNFPKVFKLRGGAGSANVKLAKSKSEAQCLILKAFGRGFSPFDRLGYLKEKYRHFKEGKDSLGLIKGLYRLIISPKASRSLPKEIEYVYFQDFIPNNYSDTRIIVVGDKAIGIKRMTRKGDFRASGSGNIIYDKNQININCVKQAFAANNKLQSQCTAFDFVFDIDSQPIIVEISYGFIMKLYDNCEGYWDSKLFWHNEFCNPQKWIIENLINNEKRK